MAYSLKAFASLLANAASKFTRYSNFSTPIIIAILFLSLLVFTLFGSNFSYPFATFVSFISTFILTLFSELLFHLSTATKVNSSPALVSIINPSNKNSPSSLIWTGWPSISKKKSLLSLTFPFNLYTWLDTVIFSATRISGESLSTFNSFFFFSNSFSASFFASSNSLIFLASSSFNLATNSHSLFLSF